MADIRQLLKEYGESHQHPVNKLIHWVCVPLIVWSLLAIISTIKVPDFFNRLPVSFSWAEVTIIIAMIYYFLVSFALAVGILLVFSLMLLLTFLLASTGVAIWQVALTIFILAWVGQFIGHKIEGKKPSFFKDLQFLLVGPLWLLAHIYDGLGIKY